jgi:hypothetical protein
MKGDAVYIGTSESGYADVGADVKPGEVRHLVIFVRKGPGASTPNVCVKWSVEPASAVVLDEKARTIRVTDAAVKAGQFTVQATIPNLAQPLTRAFRVIDPKANPVAGVWHEAGPAKCKGGPAAADTISEFDISADGGFSVTWHPFETYRDYWGHYTLDAPAGTIRLVMEEGNFTPKDFQGTGRFSIEKSGRLRLEGVWLGDRNSDGKGLRRSCTYELTR